MGTIPSYPELTTVDDNSLFPVDSGIQTFKATAPTIKAYMTEEVNNDIAAVNANINGINATLTQRLWEYYTMPVLNWTPRSGTSSVTFTGVTYSPSLNRFCAVNIAASATSVMTSDDGVTWTNRTTATALFQDVTWGNSLFVIVGTNTGTQIQTSPDGITWTTRTGPANGAWKRIIYAGGKFVAVGGNGLAGGPNVMTSTDGITWTARTTADIIQFSDIAYSGGIYVATTTANNAWTSTDGITWTQRVVGSIIFLLGVAYGNGRFVACSQSGTAVFLWTSTDGITWLSGGSILNMGVFRTIRFVGGIFVIIGHRPGGGAIANITTSLDGVSWFSERILLTNATAASWYQITYGQDMFVIVGSNTTFAAATSLKSV